MDPLLKPKEKTIIQVMLLNQRPSFHGKKSLVYLTGSDSVVYYKCSSRMKQLLGLQIEIKWWDELSTDDIKGKMYPMLHQTRHAILNCMSCLCRVYLYLNTFWCLNISPIKIFFFTTMYASDWVRQSPCSGSVSLIHLFIKLGWVTIISGDIRI